MTNTIYTATYGMFRVVEQDGLFYPEAHIVTCRSYQSGRIATESLRLDLIANKWNVWDSGWSRFHMGWDCRGENKGDKRFKSEKAAIAFVERCAINLQEAA